MPAWTLSEAKARLQKWLDAETAVATGQAYQIGTKRLDRASLKEIREEIMFWKKQVEQLELLAARGARRRAYRITPRDL